MPLFACVMIPGIISIAEMTMMHPIMTNILVLGFSMDSEG